MIMHGLCLQVSDSNVWVLGGFSFILTQKINAGNMEINHTPTFIIEPEILQSGELLVSIRFSKLFKNEIQVKVVFNSSG